MVVLGLCFCVRAFSSCGKWGPLSSWCVGLSSSWPLLLRSTASRHAGSVIVAHGPSCSATCGTLPDQDSNPCPLHWQADSQPLHHEGSPNVSLFSAFYFQGFGSSLLSLFWILFHVDYLSPLHLLGLVRFCLAPSSAVCFSVLILLNLLCLGSPFQRLQVSSFRCFSCLSPVAKVGLVGCVGFLVEGTSTCVLVDEAGSCLSGRQVHFWWCVLGCLWPYYDFRQPLC